MKIKTLTLLANTENHIPLPCAVGGLAYVSGPTVLTVKTTDNDAYPPLSPNGVIYFDRVYGDRGSQDPSLILLGSGTFTLIFLKPGERWEFPTISVLNPDTGLYRYQANIQYDNDNLLYQAPTGASFDPNNPPNVPWVKLIVANLTVAAGGYLYVHALNFLGQDVVPLIYNAQFVLIPDGHIVASGDYFLETTGIHNVKTDGHGVLTGYTGLVYCKNATWPVR